MGKAPAHADVRHSQGTDSLLTICEEALGHGVAVVGLLHAERVDGSSAAPHGCHLGDIPLLLEQIVWLSQAPKPAACKQRACRQRLWRSWGARAFYKAARSIGARLSDLRIADRQSSLEADPNMTDTLQP